MIEDVDGKIICAHAFKIKRLELRNGILVDHSGLQEFNYFDQQEQLKVKEGYFRLSSRYGCYMKLDQYSSSKQYITLLKHNHPKMKRWIDDNHYKCDTEANAWYRVEIKSTGIMNLHLINSCHEILELENV